MKPLWEALKNKMKKLKTYSFSHLSFKILTFEIIQMLDPEIIIEMSDTERGN